MAGGVGDCKIRKIFLLNVHVA
ncbi:protein of unknown function [Burkholderia multivorans]